MRFFGILALSVGLAACASSQTATSHSGADAATLEAYHWQLREVRDGQGQTQPGWKLPAAPAAAAIVPEDSARMVVLNFAGNQVSVGRLCNALAAGYALQGHALHIADVRSTRMACPDSAAMVLEQKVGQRLPQANRWRIAQLATPAAQSGAAPSPVLTLEFPDGGQWILQGTPTDATRYGSAGERMFLEVAPQRVACSHPLIPNHQCLQVREIEYDSQGLKTRVGHWQNWYGEIQGYTHQPGVRNVLRVQRYARPHAPADAPAFVDVLDMTVESEIVR